MADGADLGVRGGGVVPPRTAAAPAGGPGGALDGAAAGLLEAFGTGVVLHDTAGRLRRLDAAAAVALRVDRDHARGRTWHDPAWGAVHEDGRPMAGHEHPVMRTLADGGTRRGSVVGLAGHPPVGPGAAGGGSSPGTSWVRFDVTALPDGSVAAMVTDVTEAVQARLDGVTEHTRTRRLLAPERDVVASLDRRGRVLVASAAAEDVLGRPPADLVGCSLVELVAPADRPAVQERFAVLAPDDVAVLRVRVRRRGGERRWARLGMRWLDPDMTTAHVVLADAHETVQATTRAEELHEQLAAVSAVARDTVALHSAEGTFTWVSARSVLDLGWQPGDLLGRSLHELVHPDDVALVDAAHGRSATGDVVQVRFRCRGADQRWRLVESELSGVLDRATGRLLQLRSATRAADAAVTAEQRLLTAEELFHRGFDTSPAPTALLGEDPATGPGWLRVNDALLDLLGRSRGSVLRLPVPELLVEPDPGGSGRDDALNALDGLLLGTRDAWRGPVALARGDGTLLRAEVTAQAVRTEPGAPGHVLLHVLPEEAPPGGARAVLGTDALTGLPDRWLAMDRLVNALQRATRSGQTVGVAVVSLDGLSELVAQRGQAAGDSVVVEAAGRVAASLRTGDTLSRVAEDTFLVLCEDVHELTLSRVAAGLSHELDIPAPGTASGSVVGSVGCVTRPCAGGQDPFQVAEEAVAAAAAAAHDVRLRGGGGWQLVKHSLG